ncbi:hypothetical protein XANCAGTX0491_006957 [Xanthoria calcicola]
MKTFHIAALFAFAPNGAFAACNADNVLRALQNNAAKASPFCSTYTLPPPNQPLPTYVSQYPASRVSSGCSCLITPGPTTLTTSTTRPTTISTTSSSSLSRTSTTTSTLPSYTPGQLQCSGELIRNGNFETTTSASEAPPWEFAQPVNPNSGQESRADLVFDNGTNYALLTVLNSPVDGSGGYGSTYIRQPIPDLCKYVYYTFSFDAKTEVYSGYSQRGCTLEINLNGRQLVYIAPGGSEYLPYEYQRRSYTFQYGGCAPYGVSCSPQALTVRFTCEAPRGSFLIDNISLVGAGEYVP